LTTAPLTPAVRDGGSGRIASSQARAQRGV
jgi:hypothetical protein